MRFTILALGDGLTAEILRVSAIALLAGLLAAASAVVFLRQTEQQYTAILTVGPTARSGGAGVGMRTLDLGGGAGVAEPGPAEEVLSDFSRYLELLRALPTAEALAADTDVMRRLFSGRWDAAAQTWGPSPGVWAAVKRAVLSLAGRPEWTPPDAVALADELRRRVVISPVGTGPMRRVSFRHVDRDFALATLTRLAQAADGHLKTEAARRAQAQIGHIRARLNGRQVAEEHRDALSRLLLEQEQVLMALGVDLPFAADVLEPPHAAAYPDWPDALLATAGSALAGFALAVFFASGRLLRLFKASA